MTNLVAGAGLSGAIIANLIANEQFENMIEAVNMIIRFFILTY